MTATNLVSLATKALSNYDLTPRPLPPLDSLRSRNKPEFNVLPDRPNAPDPPPDPPPDGPPDGPPPNNRDYRIEWFGKFPVIPSSIRNLFVKAEDMMPWPPKACKSPSLPSSPFPTPSPSPPRYSFKHHTDLNPQSLHKTPVPEP